MIYLDNAATTRVCSAAINAAAAAMSDTYYNPNATYKAAIAAKNDIDKSRRVIADILGVLPEEIYFTSCATESNNWVLTCGKKNGKGNVIISAGEHSSVYEPAMALKNRGTDVRVCKLDKSGAVDINAFSAILDQNTTLVSVIHVSNETGVVNQLKHLVDITKKASPRCLFHSDGVQGALKCGQSISETGVDLYSMSAHKLGGPKGIGLLYVRKGINIAPFILGGGQENGMRSGTQNTPYISAFAAALNEFSSLDKNGVLAARNALVDYFTAHDCEIIGSTRNSGYILCVRVPGVKAEILQTIAADRGVIIGKGAACSGSKRGNRVLSAMGVSSEAIEQCIRLSLYPDITPKDALEGAKIIMQCAKKIRSGNVG